MIKTIICIGIGGGFGSIFRYLTSLFIDKYIHTNFPLATCTVNVVGCLIIGILLGLFEWQALPYSNLKFLLITGFCGGYTTFSAFASENIHLFQSGNSLTAFFYIAVSIIMSLFAVWLGLTITKTY
ncbi:MAG: fluoride efflux transporter CrcB [Bacteroidales bacterium]|nr:fluoride efflux transporter CrcB [Bacteroidales bacterium]